MNEILQGDSLFVLKTIPSESVDCVVTSPPYWALRDYGVSGQLGLESTFYEYIAKLIKIFDEVKRVLKKTGTCWVNLGDTYGTGSGAGERNGLQRTNRGTQNFEKWKKNGKKSVKQFEKSLLQIPSRFAIAMADHGWILRNEIIWHKPNVMPQSCRDRFTVDFEKIYFFTKSKKYYFEQQFESFESNDYDRARMAKARTEYGNGKWARESGGAIKTQRAFVAGHAQGRNKRCVWSINTHPTKAAHFATYPCTLIEPMIKAGSPRGGAVMDPFMGSGTTAFVARQLGRNYLGIELNLEYIKLAEKRLAQQNLFFKKSKRVYEN